MLAQTGHVLQPHVAQARSTLIVTVQSLPVTEVTPRVGWGIGGVNRPDPAEHVVGAPAQSYEGHSGLSGSTQMVGSGVVGSHHSVVVV